MTRPTSSGKANGNEPTTVAKISLISAIAVALIGAAAAVVTTVIKRELPNTAVSSPAPQAATPSSNDGDGSGDMPPVDGTAQVEFDPETIPPIHPHEGAVPLSGTVTGLGSDTLWILSFHLSGRHYYLVQQPGLPRISPAATDKDRTWYVVDQSPGDVSDVGKSIIYYAVQADANCATKLSSLPPDDQSFPHLFTGCHVAKKGPSVPVT
jgi:hypothetical protein